MFASPREPWIEIALSPKAWNCMTPILRYNNGSSAEQSVQMEVLLTKHTDAQDGTNKSFIS